MTVFALAALPAFAARVSPTQDTRDGGVSLEDLRGLWIRVGDDYQGMVMEIEGPTDALEGRLVHVPALAVQWGFRAGDRKVKDITRTGADELSLRSLVKTFADGRVTRVEYNTHVVYTRGRDELLFRQARGKHVRVGAWQRWIRTDRSKRPYWREAEHAAQSGGATKAPVVTGSSGLESSAWSLDSVRASVAAAERAGEPRKTYDLPDFEGAWVRADDAFAGMMMEIAAADGGSLEGHLVAAPPVARENGFAVGQRKIRNLRRVGDDEFSVESLTSAMDGRGRRFQSYGPDFVYTRGKNELIFVQQRGAELQIGAWQRWLRVTEAHPDYDEYWYGKGMIAEHEKRWREATEHYRTALRLSPNASRFLNAVAWRLATNPVAEDRDADLAVEYARLACKKTAFKEANYLDTLAAAHAANGSFQEARKFQRRACDLLEKVPSSFSERLRLYERSQPYVESDAE